jgi:hypothetical protein
VWGLHHRRSLSSRLSRLISLLSVQVILRRLMQAAHTAHVAMEIFKGFVLYQPAAAVLVVYVAIVAFQSCPDFRKSSCLSHFALHLRPQGCPRVHHTNIRSQQLQLRARELPQQARNSLRPGYYNASNSCNILIKSHKSSTAMADLTSSGRSSKPKLTRVRIVAFPYIVSCISTIFVFGKPPPQV